VYHVEYDAPGTAGRCDNEGAELYQREDDREETIRHRLKVYREQTAPLVEFYEAQGMLATIAATGSVEEVTARAKAAIEKAGADS
jgi:adenylate kinase